MVTAVLNQVIHPWYMCLASEGWLACSTDPRSYAGRSLTLLAGPNKLDRSLGEGPDEAYILVLHTRGFGSGLTTWNCKKDTVTETATKTPTTTVCNGLLQSSETCINANSESRKEATDRKTEVLSAKNHSWGITIQRLASDGQGWRSFTAALYTNWREG